MEGNKEIDLDVGTLPVERPLHVGVQFMVHREKCISIQSNPQRSPAYPVWNSVNNELDGYNGLFAL